ncbi:MAG: GTP cyclohydrolase I [Acidobacteriota bacterium]|jgi:GTP cyclohydrolase I
MSQAGPDADASTREPAPDRDRLRRAAEEFLLALDVIDDPAMREATARRIADAWGEDLLSGYRTDPVALLDPMPVQGSPGLVVVRDIPFTSFCVHHLLPFSGMAHLAYLPDRQITGLSKLARMVDALARRLQIQEQLTRQMVRAIDARLEPRGAGAVVEADHLCMTARGIRSRGSRVLTSAWCGALEADPAAREGLLGALRPGR